MKRFALILAVMMLVACMAVAEEADESVLTLQNCEALAALANAEYPFEDAMEAFAARYVGEVVSIDGFIYDMSHSTMMRDIEMQIGNYEEATQVGPHFLFAQVKPQDFGFEASEFPDFIQYGSNIRVVGRIEEYDDFEECIVLEPISIEARNPLTEGLDADTYDVLEKGSKGEAVKALQQRLIELYFLDGDADGIFGNGTKKAVEAFQKAAKLEVTGIADPTTQAVLFSEKAPKDSLSISSSSVVVGSNAKTVWYVDGQEFTLQGNKTKTVKTRWGTYKFDAFGNAEKLED